MTLLAALREELLRTLHRIGRMLYRILLVTAKRLLHPFGSTRKSQEPGADKMCIRVAEVMLDHCFEGGVERESSAPSRAVRWM